MEDEATLRSEIKSNERAMRVMRHKWLSDNLLGVCTGHGVYIETFNPQAFEPSSLEP